MSGRPRKTKKQKEQEKARVKTQKEIEDYAAELLTRAFRRVAERRRILKAKEKQLQNDQEVLQSFWDELEEGIAVWKVRRSGGNPVKRKIWLDQTGWRLCIARKISTTNPYEKGLFLLDISAVWTGAKTPTFSKLPTVDPTKCCSLIGTERTLDFVFPSTQERNELAANFRVLLRVLHTRAKQAGLGYHAIHIETTAGLIDIVIAAQVKNRLSRGVRVIRVGKRHQRECILRLRGPRLYLFQVPQNEQQLIESTGIIIRRRSIKEHFEDANELEVKNVEELEQKSRPHKKANSNAFPRPVLESEEDQILVGQEDGVFVPDIVEVRPGIYTANYSFNMLKSHAANDQIDTCCCSIVASERTINLRMPTHAMRDEFVANFNVFLRQFQLEDENLQRALLRETKLQTA